MLYSEISYSNEVYKQATKLRQQIRSNPNEVRTFWSSVCHNYISPIVAMLSYFTGTHLNIRYTTFTRNDSLTYVFQSVNRVTKINTTSFEQIPYDAENNIPYTYLNIDLVGVRYQITDCFEHTLPEIYSAANGYSELTGFSLALKMTPRHRIRVYAKTVHHNNGVKQRHVVIASTNNFFNYDDDFELYRKVLAIIPLLDERQEAERSMVHNDRIQYYKNFIDLNDATDCLDKLCNFLNSIPAFKDLETLSTVAVLQNLNNMHINSLDSRLIDIAREVENALAVYTDVLKRQRTLQYERAGLSDEALTQDDLKMLIEKKIIQQPMLENDMLTYRCSSPCLSFDKEAAKIYYRNLDKHTSFAKLFKLAFIDEQVIIMFEDIISIRFNQLTFTGQSIPVRYAYPTNIMRNPHHRHYNCWGNYGPIINKLIQQYSFMQMFMQIKAAVGSLNLTDYTVLNQFKHDIIQQVRQSADNPYTAKFIVWKSEKDMSKLHTLEETLQHFKEGDTDNETN